MCTCCTSQIKRVPQLLTTVLQTVNTDSRATEMRACFSNPCPGLCRGLECPWIPGSAAPWWCGSCSPWRERARSAESWLWPASAREGGACWWWGQHRPSGQPPPPRWHDLHLQREQHEVTCLSTGEIIWRISDKKKISAFSFLNQSPLQAAITLLKGNEHRHHCFRLLSQYNTFLGNRNCCYLGNLRSGH